MKKAHLFFLPIFFTLIFLVPNAFAQNSDPSPYKEFVAASLHDKAVILENAPENTSQKFYEMSLSFVYDNKVLIEDLPDYYILLLATIGKLDANGSDGIDELLLKIYKDFDDYSVRLAVLDAFSRINIKSPAIYDFVMEIVTSELEKNENISVDIFVSCLDALGNIKNPDCCDLLFSILKEGLTQEIIDADKNALYNLMDGFYVTASYIVRSGSFEDKLLVLNLITENPKKDKKSCAEIAEILLSESIILDEGTQEKSQFTKEQIDLQYDSFICLQDAKWTKATDLVLKYFEVACYEYENKLLDLDRFCNIIKALKDFPTRNTCKVLTEFLASQYKHTVETGKFEAEILVSVINTLGELGDNEAFDTILYVMSWKDYPHEISQASNEALKKLRW